MFIFTTQKVSLSVYRAHVYRNKKIMQFIFKSNDGTQKTSLTRFLRHPLTFSAYSNLGYKSTPDLTVDTPSVYTLEQQYQSKNAIHVMIKLIVLFHMYFL